MFAPFVNDVTPAVEKGLQYQDSHEWAKVDGDTATVGISDFAQVRCEHVLGSSCVNAAAGDHSLSIPLQAELGDIVYVELPEVGSEVKQGEQFGVIESVKVSQCPCHTIQGQPSELFVSA